MYKAGIFDLDGTVLDSMKVWREIDIQFLGKRGLEVPDDYLKEITALGFQAAATYTKNRFGFPESEEEIIAEWYGMAREAYGFHVGLKPGAREYLEAMKRNGIPIVAATASDETLFEPCLKNNGIYDLFDDFVTVKEVSRGKGFPDIYELAAKKLGAPVQDCVVFEDILKGIQGAVMGNFSCVAMYDEESIYEWDAVQKLANRSITDFQVLIPLVHQGGFEIEEN